jgi:enoyl-CoA hydratase/carnithine racemase
MIRALYPQLLKWQENENIVAVFIDSSSERGLCSGGNIRHLYDSMVAKHAIVPNPLALDFFSEEYQLDQLIHDYKKPIIVWGHGIVMGGGVGLMVGASHRITTPASILAMPEIGIGLFPDVGGSWFLNRMPEGCGLFVGLTGAHIKGKDGLHTKLANHILANESKTQVLEQLITGPWSTDSEENYRVVTAICENHDISATLPMGNLERHQHQIQTLTNGSDITQITDNLLNSNLGQADNQEEHWWNSAITNLSGGCPTTAHLVFQQLRRSEGKTLPEIFEMELTMAMQCVAHPDFREGVRALLVDKDKNPRWQHNSIADVPNEWVNEHFHPFKTL